MPGEPKQLAREDILWPALKKSKKSSYVIVEVYTVSEPLNRTVYSNTHMVKQQHKDNVDTEPKNWRKWRAEKLTHTVRRAGPNLWTVNSSTNVGTYRIECIDGGWQCNCPDHIKRHLDCKHILAVRLQLEHIESKPQAPVIVSPKEMNNSLRDWSAYNKGQTEEWAVFGQLLADLAGGLEEPAQTRGRPRMPLSSRVFAAVLKVYSQQSSRRAQGLYQRAVEDSQLKKAPHFNTASKFFNTEEATVILRELIQQSALPMAGIERDFAIDSSGFRCATYSQWCDKKHGANNYGDQKTVDWLKAHIITGCLTNIAADVIVTDGYCHDSPFFEPLVNSTAAAGFDMWDITADKAYSSKKNHEVAINVGARALIPFRSNASGKTRGSAAWKKAFQFFQLYEEEFYRRYHKRSNVETSFGCIKRKFGEVLRSKSRVAQENELLAKFLCYNITVLVRAMHEFGINPDFLNGGIHND